LHFLTVFLKYALYKLPKTYGVVVAALSAPATQARLSDNALWTPLDLLPSFLNFAQTREDLKEVRKTIVAGLSAPANRARLSDNALRTPLDLLASFLSFAQTREDLKEVGTTIVAALSAPANRARLSEAALRTPLADVASFLSFAQTREDLKEVGKTIVAALSAPANQARLAQAFLRTPLSQVLSFWQLGANQKELQVVVSGLVSAVDRTAWDRIRIATPAMQPSCVHTAAGMFQLLDRAELMEAPARASILSADVPSWHGPDVCLHDLSQVLRLGRPVEPRALQSFIEAVATESWLAGQYRSASAGTIAAALYSIWAYYGDRTLRWFITDSLHARLRVEVNRFRRLPTPLLSGAISLAGVCGLSGMVLSTAAAWPTVEQVYEVLAFAARRVGMTEIGYVQVQLWLGLREVARLCSDEIRVPKQLAEQIREIWHNSKPTLERHVLVKAVMIPWLDRCSESGWVLIRAEESLHDRLSSEAARSLVQRAAT
jgi:hypothetical protein